MAEKPETICSSCIVKSDKQEKIHEIYKDKFQKLKEFEEKINTDLPFFTENAQHLFELREQRLGNYNKIKQQILNKEEETKDKIADQAFSLIKKLDNWWSPQNAEISEEQKLMSEAENDLKQRKNIIEEAIQSEKKESIMTAADLVIKELPRKVVKRISTPTQVIFSEKKIKLDLRIGSLLTIPKLEVVQSIDCDVTTHLCALDQDVMIGYNKSNKTIKQFIVGQNICHFKEKIGLSDNGLRDATFTSDGKVICTRYDYSSYIYQLDFKNKKTCELYYISYYTYGIHARKNDTFIIGFKGNFTGINSIAIFTNDGKKIETLNETGEEPFHIPHTITTNINEDICVIDALSEKSWEGRVITLEKDGKFKWMYEGHPEINSEKKFTPRGITTTPIGQILITDTDTNTIHMLSMDGVFMTSIGEAEGIKSPQGLTSKYNQIFVGCPGKLHILKIKEA